MFDDQKKREFVEQVLYREYRNDKQELAWAWDPDQEYVAEIQEQLSEEEFVYLKKIIELVPEQKIASVTFVFQLLTVLVKVREIAKNMSLENNPDWEEILLLRSITVKDWSHE